MIIVVSGILGCPTLLRFLTFLNSSSPGSVFQLRNLLPVQAVNDPRGMSLFLHTEARYGSPRGADISVEGNVTTFDIWENNLATFGADNACMPSGDITPDCAGDFFECSPAARRNAFPYRTVC